MLVNKQVELWSAVLGSASMMDEPGPIDKSLAGQNGYTVLCGSIRPVFLPSRVS